MKILYVDLQYDYGIPERGLNLIGQNGFLKSFCDLGHSVEAFYYDTYLNDLEKLQQQLIFKADSSCPDLIFFCLYQNQIQKKTLQYLKNKYKTINFFGDDQWRFESFTAEYAPHFTYCITTDYFSIPKYKKIGLDNVIFSQWAALSLNHQQHLIPDYKYDVTFVGGHNSVREWFTDEIRNSGVDVQCFGNGWKNGPVSQDKMIELFATSKINLNLSNSRCLDFRYLSHHWKNPLKAFRTQKTSSQIKARNFEIPCYGGFQLADFVPGLDFYFDIGKNIVCYSNIDESISLVHFYLENSPLREQIKHQSIQYVREQHTYFNRFNKIFTEIGC